MALERDFITPADIVVQTTANVVGNTAFVDLYSNTARAQTYPVFSQNFALNPYLDSRWTYVRQSNGTYMASNGTISIARANTPRFDYDPVTLQSKGLLLEEGRTNLVWNSSQMVGSGWFFGDGLNNLNAEIIADAGVAPNGSNTAAFFRHVTDINTFYTYVQPIATQIANNVTYTYSVFVNSNTSPQEPSFTVGQYDNLDGINSILINFSTAANGSITGFTGGSSGSNVQLHSIGSQNYPNGWVRVYYSFRYTNGARFIQIKHDLNGGGLTPATNRVRGIYLWGSQLEQGPFPTSFIPTPPTATASRVADYAYIDGNKLNTFKDDKSMTIVDTVSITGYHGNTTMTNSSEQRYTIIWRLENNPIPSTPGNQFDPPLGFNYGQFFAYQSTDHRYFNGTATPHTISMYGSIFNQVENYLGFPSYTLAVNNYITNATTITTAMTMRSNNYIFVTNGTLLSTTSNYFAGANNNYFQIGPLNGYFKRLAVYNTQLSNTEMINITTT